MKKWALFLLLALQCAAQPMPVSMVPLRTRTNNFLLTWEKPSGFLIFSNRITRTISNSVTRWWVPDVTQTVFSVIYTQGTFVPWNVTVSALGIQLSPESLPAFWPPPAPTNRVIEFFTMLSPSNRLLIFSITNPTDNYFVRFVFLPPDGPFTNPMWFPQGSHDLKSWAAFGSPIIAPQNPKLQLNTTNYAY